MGGVILASEGVGCNFWPREGCKNEGSSHGDPPSPPPVPTCEILCEANRAFWTFVFDPGIFGAILSAMDYPNS